MRDLYISVYEKLPHFLYGCIVISDCLKRNIISHDYLNQRMEKWSVATKYKAIFEKFLYQF